MAAKLFFAATVFLSLNGKLSSNESKRLAQQTKMKLFNSHLSTQLLADVAEGKTALTTDLKQHLNDCSRCAGELAALHRVVTLMRRDVSSDAPPTALQFARNIFRAQKGLVPQPETQMQKILASLKIDLSAFSPAFGERSAGSAAERQMLFAAGDYDLDLRLEKTENGFAVRGQVLSELTGKCLIRFEGADFTVDSPVDKFGSFSVSSLPSIDECQISLVFVE